MTKQLRKKHLQVWSLLAITLPVMILAGVLGVKNPVVTGSLFQPAASTALPLITHSVEKGKYTVHLRSSADRSQTQLEWINKASVTNPSALIYQRDGNNKEIDGNEIIGRIESKGIYRFFLKNDSARSNHFFLYDIIHRQIIDSINF